MANDDNDYRLQAAALSGAHRLDRSDSSSSELSAGSVQNSNQPHLQSTTPDPSERPGRPILPKRKSSAWVIHCSDDVGPHESRDDERDMSPRRTSMDIEAMQKQSREELRKHARLLQETLLSIFERIKAVREEHKKLDNNNKFLQKYIGDLMSTSKITATGGKGKK